MQARGELFFGKEEVVKLVKLPLQELLVFHHWVVSFLSVVRTHSGGLEANKGKMEAKVARLRQSCLPGSSCGNNQEGVCTLGFRTTTST